MSDWNVQVIEQFRAGEARVAGMFDRENLLLLHTTGARTGQERISPVATFTLEGRRVVVASKGGAPEHPAWYHNLLKNPQVTIEVADGDQIATRTAVAESVTGTDHERLWQQLVAVAPGFGEYQKKTDRIIPVVALNEG